MCICVVIISQPLDQCCKLLWEVDESHWFAAPKWKHTKKNPYNFSGFVTRKSQFLLLVGSASSILTFAFCCFVIIIILNGLLFCLTIHRETIWPCPPVTDRKEINTYPTLKLAIPGNICETYDLFTLLPHLLHTSLFYKKTRYPPTRWLFWDISWPSSPPVCFLNKVVFLASTPHLWFIGLLCSKQIDLGLGNMVHGLLEVPRL